jgi:hypothetical protein
VQGLLPGGGRCPVTAPSTHRDPLPVAWSPEREARGAARPGRLARCPEPGCPFRLAPGKTCPDHDRETSPGVTYAGVGHGRDDDDDDDEAPRARRAIAATVTAIAAVAVSAVPWPAVLTPLPYGHAVESAACWLGPYLAARGGQALSADIKRDGQAAGHSVPALVRARQRAGIAFTWTGGPRHHQTTWRIAGAPDAPATPAAPAAVAAAPAAVPAGGCRAASAVTVAAGAVSVASVR